MLAARQFRLCGKRSLVIWDMQAVAGWLDYPVESTGA